MKPLTTHIASWLIVGLTVLPLISDAGQETSSPADERLEWLLASHDVRHAIRATSAASSECLDSETESGR
ncbi:MAG: hypothetical protein ACREV5_00900 [Steroidobacter sp.]